MKVGICYTKINAHAVATCEAFKKGVLASGDEAIDIHEHDLDEVNNVDVVFQIADTSSYLGKDFRYYIKEIADARGIRRMITDVGFFSLCNKRYDNNDLDRYVSIGFDGIKNNAKYYTENSPSDRWDALNIDIKKWKAPDGKVLVLGQFDKGLSVSGFDYKEWLRSLYEQLRMQGYDMSKVVLRKHPNQTWFPKGINISENANIADDLNQSTIAISYCTNAGIDAMISGLRSLVGSKTSMIYNEDNLLSEATLENPPIVENRDQLLYNMAYAQWHMKEIEEGLPWRKLRENV